jgi:hypothetical protein
VVLQSFAIRGQRQASRARLEGGGVLGFEPRLGGFDQVGLEFFERLSLGVAAGEGGDFGGEAAIGFGMGDGREPNGDYQIDRASVLLYRASGMDI